MAATLDDQACHHCVATRESSTNVFAHDTAVVGLLTTNGQKVYVDGMEKLFHRYLFLNINKTKELDADVQ